MLGEKQKYGRTRICSPRCPAGKRGKLGCPTRVTLTTRAMTTTTTTTTTMSRWCWRRKCYFFGTLSDRSKDIRRYSCQNVAKEWTKSEPSCKSSDAVLPKRSKTAMKLVAKNHDDRLVEWNFIERLRQLLLCPRIYLFFRVLS